MIIDNNMVPKISDSVKVRNEEFGLLLVSKKTPILALNEDSQLIWECIDEIRTVLQIAEDLNKQIEGELDNTTKTVKCFVESCYELRLIELGR